MNKSKYELNSLRFSAAAFFRQKLILAMAFLPYILSYTIIIRFFEN